MPSFDVNTDEVIRLSNRLEKLHRSALPIAVRGTLNDAAFEAKQKHVEKTFDKQFTIRKSNFIRSHTIVNKSINTFNINQMVSEMGVIKGKSSAGDELDKQEFGGTVSNRSFIPMDTARASKSHTKLVSKKFYLKNIKGKRRQMFKNQEFIKAAFKVGINGYVLFNNVLFQVKKLVKRGRNTLFIKLNPLYSFKKGRSINLKRSPFIEPAGLLAAKNMGNLFAKNAQRQINKYFK